MRATKEVCGDYLVVSPDTVLRNKCVVFDTRIQGLRDSKPREGRVKIITHGLISTHTHLGLYPIRTSLSRSKGLDDWVERYAWPWEVKLRSDRRLTEATATLAIEYMLSSGITAFADMHFNEDVVGEVAERVGIRADLSVAIMNRGVFRNFEEGLEENLELLRRFKGGELIRVRLGPCTPRLLTPEEFREVVSVARKLGVGIHTHLGEVPEDHYHLLRNYGLSLGTFINYVGLREVNAVIAHIVWPFDAFGELSGLLISHPPRSNIMLRDGVAPVPQYLRRGYLVSLGIDVAPTYDVREDALAAYVLHSLGGGLGVNDLFKMVSEVGYKYLGLGEGTLKVGSEADIVVWESREGGTVDPVAEVLFGGAEVIEAYVNGARVYGAGKLTGIESSELRRAEELVREALQGILIP